MVPQGALQGVDGGFWVEAPPYRGYAKPKNPNSADPMTYPCAAHEKIASDLAYELRLPVPPVTLFVRTGAQTGEPVHHAVSMPPFVGLNSYGIAMTQPAVANIVRPQQAPCMSAMAVFDTWVSNTDHRGHPYNLLIAVDMVIPLTTKYAFIDYAWAFDKNWNQWTDSYRSSVVAPMYDWTATPDTAVMAETVTAIQQIPDAVIRRIVDRVPKEFISDSNRLMVYDGLIYRRDNLRTIVSTNYAGLP